MNRQHAWVDRVVTTVLAISICVIVGFVVIRLVGSITEPLPRFTFSAGWRGLIASGTVIGDTAAPIQIIEFVDLQCPACKQQHAALRRLTDELGTRVALTFVHLPLSTHPFARLAANAAECAHQQGVLMPFMDAAFAHQDSIGQRQWNAFGRDAGVRDSAAFKTCVNSRTFSSRVERGVEAAQSDAVRGTPVLLINGWRHDGALSYRALKKATARLLAGEPLAEIGPEGATAAGDGSSSIGAFDITYDTLDLMRAPQLRVSAVPLASTDGQSANLDIGFGIPVELLSDNRFVVLAGRQLHLFDADARWVRMLAGDGSGPGELRGPTDMARIRGDTLVVADPGNARILWINPDGTVPRERSMRAEVPPRLHMVAGALPDGRLVLHRAWGPTLSRVPNSRDSLQVGVLPSEGPASIVMERPGMEFAIVETRYFGRLGQQAVPPFFGGQPTFALWNGRIAISAGDAFEVELIDAEGSNAGAIRLRRPRQPVTDAMRRAVLERGLRALRDQVGGEAPQNRAEVERVLRATPFQDSLPAIQFMQVTPAGVLWILDSAAPADTAWFATGFREDGSIVARLTGPLPGRPVAFGRDRVIVRHEDADGVHSLRIHLMVPQR